jgi:hypothetical protein
LKAEIVHVNTGIVIDILTKTLTTAEMTSSAKEYIKLLYIPNKISNYETEKKVNQFITTFAKEMIAHKGNIGKTNKIAYQNWELVLKQIDIARQAGKSKGYTDDVWLDRTMDAFNMVEKVLPRGYPIYLPDKVVSEKYKRMLKNPNKN